MSKREEAKNKDRVRLSTLNRYRDLDDFDKYERELLASWEDVYKKGHLTLWILLALKHGPKHMAQIKNFISAYTNRTLQADDKSMYRALRRYYDTELVDFKQRPGKNGPDLKVYRLTETGKKILERFLSRNIVNVFFTAEVKKLIERSK